MKSKDKIKQTKALYSARFLKENGIKALKYASKPFFSRLKDKLENK